MHDDTIGWQGSLSMKGHSGRVAGFSADAWFREREGHAYGCHTRKVAVHDHNAVGFRHDGGNALKTSAGCHGIFHNGVGIETLQIAVRLHCDVLIDILPLPFIRFQTGSFVR